MKNSFFRVILVLSAAMIYMTVLGSAAMASGMVQTEKDVPGVKSLLAVPELKASSTTHSAVVIITAPQTAKVTDEVTIYATTINTDPANWTLTIKDVNGINGVVPIVPELPDFKLLKTVGYFWSSQPLFQTVYCTVKFKHPGEYDISAFGGNIYKLTSDKKVIKVTN